MIGILAFTVNLDIRDPVEETLPKGEWRAHEPTFDGYAIGTDYTVICKEKEVAAQRSHTRLFVILRRFG